MTEAIEVVEIEEEELDFDIFNPQVSKVAKGLEGKVLLVYGGNNLGKSKQTTRMKKPFYLPFENGLNAIAGIPFLPINSWSDFKKVNKQLTNPRTLAEIKKKYQTIIFDEVEASARYCTKYICDTYDVETVASGNGGYGLWKEYEVEYWSEIEKLINTGFTVIFIAHKTENKEGFILPKGDKRALAPIIDNSDIVIYLKSNGIDENNKVINSSAYLAETSEFFARSRFEYIDTVIPEFSAENLEKAIIEAIERQEEAEGIEAVSFGDQKATQKSKALDFDKLKKEIIAACKVLSAAKGLDAVTEIIEKALGGKDKRVSDFVKSQVELMSITLDELKEAAKA